MIASAWASRKRCLSIIPHCPCIEGTLVLKNGQQGFVGGGRRGGPAKELGIAARGVFFCAHGQAE
jgi:hypothetical protein